MSISSHITFKSHPLDLYHTHLTRITSRHFHVTPFYVTLYHVCKLHITPISQHIAPRPHHFFLYHITVIPRRIIHLAHHNISYHTPIPTYHTRVTSHRISFVSHYVHIMSIILPCLHHAHHTNCVRGLQPFWADGMLNPWMS